MCRKAYRIQGSQYEEAQQLNLLSANTSVKMPKVLFTYEDDERILSEETSETMRYILERVISEGGGSNGAVEGFMVGGKTATSETLPRGQGKYISSFIGFAPADDPEIIAIAIINHPQGTYYGGTIAAPVIRQLFENILPYMGIERIENIEENE